MSVSTSDEKSAKDVQDKDAKTEGLQSNGSVWVDANKDFSLHYFDTIEAWKSDLKTTTGHTPWMKAADFTRSFAMKHMNFESEPEYIDNTNLYNSGMDADSQRKFLQKRNEQERKRSKVEFEHLTEGLREVNKSKDDSSEEDDPFLDEYGNVIEPGAKSSGEGAKGSEDKKGGKETKKGSEQKKNLKVDKSNNEKIDQIGQSEAKFNRRWKDLDNVSDSNSSNSNNKTIRSGGDENSVTNTGGRCSALSAQEQRYYLTLLQKFSHRDVSANTITTQAEWEEYNAFQNFSQAVSEEREEYQRAAQFLAQSRQKELQQISPELKQFVDEYQKKQRSRLAKYSRFFAKQGTDARLRPVITDQSRDLHKQSHYEMVEDRLLLQFGVIPKLLTPSWTRLQDSKLIIGKDSEKMRQHLFSKKHREELHDDNNALHIAKSSIQPQIIATIGALRTIFNNHLSTSNKKWTIPVVVKVLGKRKVVFVEKPFLNEALSREEKKEIYYRKATKMFLSHPWTTSNKNINRNVDAEETEEAPSENPFGDCTTDISALESFGDSSTCTEGSDQPVRKSMRIRQQKISQIDGHDDDEKDDEKALKIDLEGNEAITREIEAETTKKASGRSSITSDNTLDKDPTQLRESEKTKKTVAPPTSEKAQSGQGTEMSDKSSEKSLLDSLLQETSSLLKPSGSTKTNKGYFSDPSQSSFSNKYTRYKGEKINYVHPSLDSKQDWQSSSEENVVYRLWNLRDRTAPHTSHIRLVVRGAEHGIRHQKRSITGEKGAVTQSFTLSTKLEHVSEFGCECTSVSETTRDWLSTLLRPQSHLARLRVDASNGNLVMCQFQTLKDVSRELLSRHDTRPAEQLGVLYAALSSLLELQEGEYLLRHDERTGAFASVLRASEENKSDFDLLYKEMSEKELNLPVNPIDVHLITPWHKRQGRVPGLFAPFEIKARVTA